MPPYGYVVDYLTFGGVYRDVTLRMVEPVYIKDAFVMTQGDGHSQAQARVAVWVRNTTDAEVNVDVAANYSSEEGKQLEASQPIAIAAGKTEILELSFPEVAVDYWTPDSPALYTMTVSVGEKMPKTDKLIVHDQQRLQFGFREIDFRDDGFYLNGERVQLRGLNRHQTYPYIGAAAPRRLQRRDADILKYELGCNIVRTSHYPQSRHFLDRCDEIGLAGVRGNSRLAAHRRRGLAGT